MSLSSKSSDAAVTLVRIVHMCFIPLLLRPCIQDLLATVH